MSQMTVLQIKIYYKNCSTVEEKSFNYYTLSREQLKTVQNDEKDFGGALGCYGCDQSR